MNSASIYIAICCAAIGATTILGAPDWRSLVLLSALSVSIVGVPHGGLDHWTGRRLLFGRVGNRWWIVFFPVYLLIAFGFALAWHITPVITVLLFFVASSWHFGREDEKGRDHATSRVTSNARAEEGDRPTPLRYLGSLRSVAVGGLLIWIPSLVRSDEMRWLLTLIIPTSGIADAQQVVQWTQKLSLILVPIAGFIVVRNVLRDPSNVKYWVPIATIAIGIVTPILLSFTIYFCAWHSIQGLCRLKRQERLTNTQFASATLPLSVMAIAGIASIGWFFQDAATALTNGEQAPVLQTLFIGLSALAVPHLLLHEMEDVASYLEGDGTWQLPNSYALTPNLQKGTVS